MKADPRIIRTANFVADAAAFILEKARESISEHNQFRIALSGEIARVIEGDQQFPAAPVNSSAGDVTWLISG
jgi:hypothetical protein